MSDQQQSEQAQYLPSPEPRTSAWVKLALLLIIGAIAAGALLYIRDITRLQDQTQDLKVALDADIQAATANKLNLEGELRSQRALLARDLEQQGEIIQTISDSLARQVELAIKKHSIAGSYRNYEEKWAIQQASYLLRMANISLHLETSPEAAINYLRLASEVLDRENIPELDEVRSAVLRQISTLQTSALTNTQTPYLRLNTLLSQLPLLPLSPSWVEDKTDTKNDPELDFDSPVLERILSLFRFRVEDDLSVRSPHMVQMARQQLGLLIEQAKAALIGRREATYTSALERALLLLDVYFDASHAQVQDLSFNIAELMPLGETLALPDISEPLTLLDDYRTNKEDNLSLEAAALDDTSDAPANDLQER